VMEAQEKQCPTNFSLSWWQSSLVDGIKGT
jgi:hypothetical protein